MFLRGDKDGSLTYLVLRDEGAADRRKLLRKLETRAKRAAGAGPARLDVHDEDGILSIVDPSAYQGFVGNWDKEAAERRDQIVDFDSLTDHLAAEMNAAHALVWATGSGSHGEWGVEFRERASRRKVFREATGTIEVTNGTLQVVNYTELTQLAEDESLSLPLAGGTQWRIDLANGTYALRLRQLFDHEDLDTNNEGVFEVVYKKVTTTKGTESAIAPLWWSA